MNKTKIDSADYTFNPVTGCLHGCTYCYARGIVRRFGKPGDGTLHDLKEPELMTSTEEISGAMEPLEVYADYRICPYPFGFDPTLHRYKLERPQEVKKPQNVFVGSMTDLFGEQIPDEWIEAVFDACEKAPQHRYLFLTKNPKRYELLKKCNNLPENDNFMYGSTVTNNRGTLWFSTAHKSFVSVEPLMSSFSDGDIDGFAYTDWIIIGAETGNRKGKVIPKRKWVEAIVENCRAYCMPVFMKSSLKEIWGDPLIQEYPWDREVV